MTNKEFKQARESLSLSTSELAEELGMGKHGARWIRRIEEGGKYKPSDKLLKSFERLIKERS